MATLPPPPRRSRQESESPSPGDRDEVVEGSEAGERSEAGEAREVAGDLASGSDSAESASPETTANATPPPRRLREKTAAIAAANDVTANDVTEHSTAATVLSPPPRRTDWHPPTLPVPWRRPLAFAGWSIQMAAGSAAIVLLLAVAAAIPIVNFYVLGVLLDVAARVARGRLRDGFWLWGVAPRLGTIFLALWAMLVPIRLLAGMAQDAAIIAPEAPATTGLAVAVNVLAALVFLHTVLAMARGGQARHFLWPPGNVWWLIKGAGGRGWWSRASRELGHLIGWLQPARLWWLGVRGFLGALVWLALPTLLYLSATNRREPDLTTVVGFFLLVHVLCRLPFLQTRFAVEDRMRAFATSRDIRRLFAFAPWSWLLAVVVLYVLTLPLYLSKVVLPPRDAVWMTTLLFVVSIFPTKLALGAAYGRAARRRALELPPARWWSRWPARLLMTALVGVYVFVVILTPYISEHGRSVLFEQHAFLLPWPL